MPQFHITRSELLVKGSHCVAWSCGTLLSTLITRCHNSTQHSLSAYTIVLYMLVFPCFALYINTCYHQSVKVIQSCIEISQSVKHFNLIVKSDKIIKINICLQNLGVLTLFISCFCRRK